MDSPSDRVREVARLHHLGLELQRQHFRRDDPEMDQDQLAAAMRSWINDRPGAKLGDCDGNIRTVDPR